MGATITYKVAALNPGPQNMVAVPFEVLSVVEGGQPVTASSAVLNFPREQGKEFELDDAYFLQIAPKPEGQH